MARSKFKTTLTIHKGAGVHTLDVGADVHVDWNTLSKDERRRAYKSLMDYARARFGGGSPNGQH